MDTMTQEKYDAKTKKLEKAIRHARKQLDVDMCLQDKLVAQGGVRRAQEALNRHRLDYFELVPTSLRAEAVAA